MNIIRKIIYAYLIWASSAEPVQVCQLGADRIQYQKTIYGTVTEKVTEGCPDRDDEYIVNLWTGTLIDITADDLNPGDDVTVYYLDGEIVRTLYGVR